MWLVAAGEELYFRPRVAQLYVSFYDERRKTASSVWPEAQKGRSARPQ